MKRSVRNTLWFLVALLIVASGYLLWQNRWLVKSSHQTTDWPSGGIREEVWAYPGEYDHRVLHGPARFYQEDGSLETTLFFLDGLAQGTGRAYYPDGRLAVEADVVDAQVHGRLRTWSPDGVLETDVSCVEGKPHGTVVFRPPPHTNFLSAAELEGREIINYASGQWTAWTILHDDGVVSLDASLSHPPTTRSCRDDAGRVLWSASPVSYKGGRSRLLRDPWIGTEPNPSILGSLMHPTVGASGERSYFPPWIGDPSDPRREVLDDGRVRYSDLEWGVIEGLYDAGIPVGEWTWTDPLGGRPGQATWESGRPVSGYWTRRADGTSSHALGGLQQEHYDATVSSPRILRTSGGRLVHRAADVTLPLWGAPCFSLEGIDNSGLHRYRGPMTRAQGCYRQGRPFGAWVVRHRSGPVDLRLYDGQDECWNLELDRTHKALVTGSPTALQSVIDEHGATLLHGNFNERGRFTGQICTRTVGSAISRQIIMLESVVTSDRSRALRTGPPWHDLQPEDRRRLADPTSWVRVDGERARGEYVNGLGHGLWTYDVAGRVMEWRWYEGGHSVGAVKIERDESGAITRQLLYARDDFFIRTEPPWWTAEDVHR